MTSNKLLSDKLINRALNWIEQKWTKNHKECEICGNKEWSFSAKLLRMLNDLKIDLRQKVEITSFFSILCKSCGNTKFFEAGLLNLIEDEIKEDEASQKH